MKNIFTLLFTFIVVACMAQVPQGVSYQAVAFNSGGTPVANGTVGVKVSVLDNSATGTVVYSETHSKTTNAQGLFNLNIGQGTPTSGTFSGINWGTNAKFLKVEVDPTGGTNYTNVGVNQLMSVPYALFAENVNENNLTTPQSLRSKTSEIIVIYTATNAYGFSQYSSTGSGTWTSQTLNGTPIGAIASDSNIVIYTSTNAYGFSQYTSTGSGTWTSQTLNGTPIGSVASGKNIVVYTSTNAYGFSQYSSTGSGTWTSQTLNGSPISAVSSGENIVVYTSTNAYGFSQYTSTGSGTWTSQTLNGSPIEAIGSNKNIVVYTSTNAYGFSQYTSTGSGTWTSQTLNGTPIGLITK